MSKLFRLYGYEIKSAYLYMCKSILIFVLTSVICLTSVYGYVNYLSAKGEDSRIVLGIVLKDESDSVFSGLVEFANNISSLKGFCRLEIFDEKEGFEKLENEEIGMLMVVPEGFMEAAEHMQDTELALYTRGELTAAQYKLLGLFGGIESIMLNTESSIRAMYAGMESYVFNTNRAQMENDLMELFVMNFLGREAYFDKVDVSAYGDYSLIQHYTVAILLILCALSGGFYFRLFNRQTKKLEMVMSRGFSYKLMTAFAKIIILALPLISQMWLALVIGHFFIIKKELVGTYILADAYLYTGLIGISMAAIINLIACLIDRHMERVTVYTLVVILMSLLSGLISSTYYLPDMIGRISSIWPMASWQQLIMTALWGGKSDRSLLLCITETVILVGFGSILYARSLARHD